MFSELPKLLDRDFVIGYFLPVALFVTGTLSLLTGFGMIMEVQRLLPFGPNVDALLGTTLLAVATWIGAVLLLTANRGILRILEGYGKFNPANLLKPLQCRRYRDLMNKKAELEAEAYKAYDAGNTLPADKAAELDRVARTLADEFPSKEHILPTAIGNVIRAFEEYPRLMYGLDDIPGWSRLLTVVPKDYRALIDSAKAQADFWVNLMVFSVLFILEYIGCAINEGNLPVLWMPFAAIVVYLISYWRARSQMIEWGDNVKAAYDVFLPELRKKLGFAPQALNTMERKTWVDFSQAIIYRLPEKIPPRVRRQAEGVQEGKEGISGVQFLTDTKGKVSGAIVSASQWGDIWQDIYRLLMGRASQEETKGTTDSNSAPAEGQTVSNDTPTAEPQTMPPSVTPQESTREHKSR
jgi:hypothetical protein